MNEEKQGAGRGCYCSVALGFVLAFLAVDIVVGVAVVVYYAVHDSVVRQSTTVCRCEWSPPPAPTLPSVQEEIAAIQRRHQQYTDAINNQDVEEWKDIYPEDALVLAPGRPAISGKVLRPLIGQQMAAWKAQMDEMVVTVKRIQVHGDWANSLHGVHYVINGTETPEISKDLRVWNKRNGKWYILYNMFNSNS